MKQLALATLIALAACSQEDQTFGGTYDACVLKSGANDTAKEICQRHFARAPTTQEADAIRQTSKVQLVQDIPGGFTTGDKPWDKIEAQLVSSSEDLVITKVKVTANFYSDASMKTEAKGSPIIWPSLDYDDVTGTAIGIFAGNKAPSAFMKASGEPAQVYSHSHR
jgi:hypothetical protein